MLPQPQFGHEKLDAYKVALDFAVWAHERASGLEGTNRHARDQLLRASQSIPLNLAEGNGKGTSADRRRFFEIARGSALECAATLDLLQGCGAIGSEDSNTGKAMLVRIVSMLTRLGQQKYGEVREDGPGSGLFDYDNDSDNDSIPS